MFSAMRTWMTWTITGTRTMNSGMIERLRGSLEVGALIVAVYLVLVACLVFGEERMNRWLGGRSGQGWPRRRR